MRSRRTRHNSHHSVFELDHTLGFSNVPQPSMGVVVEKLRWQCHKRQSLGDTIPSWFAVATVLMHKWARQWNHPQPNFVVWPAPSLVSHFPVLQHWFQSPREPWPCMTIHNSEQLFTVWHGLTGYQHGSTFCGWVRDSRDFKQQKDLIIWNIINDAMNTVVACCQVASSTLGISRPVISWGTTSMFSARIILSHKSAAGRKGVRGSIADPGSSEPSLSEPSLSEPSLSTWYSASAMATAAMAWG